MAHDEPPHLDLRCLQFQLLVFSVLAIEVLIPLNTCSVYFSGSRSRHWFLLFVLSVLVNVYITDFFCYYITNEFGWDWVVTIGTIEAGILTIAVTGLSCMMVRLRSRISSEILPHFKMLKVVLETFH